MGNFDRRKFLKTIGVSTLTIGLAPVIGQFTSARRLV